MGSHICYHYSDEKSATITNYLFDILIEITIKVNIKALLRFISLLSVPAEILKLEEEERIKAEEEDAKERERRENEQKEIENKEKEEEERTKKEEAEKERRKNLYKGKYTIL